MARSFIAAVLVLVASALAGAPATATTLPPGFTESTAFSGIDTPTAIEFANNGRVFVAEKSGIIKTYSSVADTTPTQVADLTTQVHNYWDRGLLGLAVDPNYSTNPFIYVYYVRDAAPGGTPPRWGVPGAIADDCPDPPGGNTDGCVVSGRISRIPVSGEEGGAEQPLVTDWCYQFPSHTGGGLEFGADGYLYYSSGEGAAWTFADYGQAGYPSANPCNDPGGASPSPPTAEGGRLRSQDFRTSGDQLGLDGAVIRIDPVSGQGVPGNPFFSSPDANTRRIVGYGLRNGFRMVIRPGTNDVYIGDPGGQGLNGWEEIDRIPDPTAPTPRNFGWPCYEGGMVNGSPSNIKYGAIDSLNLNICENLYGDASATPPFWAYKHTVPIVQGESCINTSHAISGLAFAPTSGGTFPGAYAGAFFFADYARDCIWAMFPDATGAPNPATVINFAQDSPSPVDLEFGPGGDLFYPNIAGDQIRRIHYTGSASNNPPTAVAQATPQSGAVPLDVTFDGTNSSDPDTGDTLTYSWDLDGNGSADSTLPQPTFTYNTAGVYNVTLTVTDTAGASDTDTIQINAGSGPPTAHIDTPAAGTTWRVGQSITFSGSATDPEDGTIDPTTLDWSLILHHCSTPTACHEHHISDFLNTQGTSFGAPDHEYPSYLELRLTATDSNGNADQDTLRLDPQTSNVTVATSPPGFSVTLGDETGASPITHTSIVGATNSVTTPSPQTTGGVTYRFAGWSDGQAQSHELAAPSANRTFTATFTPITPGGPRTLTYTPEADARVQEDAPDNNYGTVQLRTDGAGNPDTDTYLRFLVNGLAADQIVSAKLRLFSASNTVDGPGVYPTSSNWGETTITWNNRPAPTGGLIADTGAVGTGVWTEWDVTPAIAGDGAVSFRLASTVSDGVNFQSRETAATPELRPQLVLTVLNDFYARPRGASPMRVPLVPAYNACTSPNRMHGPPLDSPSCNPPVQSSSQLTVGTFDANGVSPNSIGFAMYDVIVGAPGTPEDEADVRLQFALSDVRNKADLTDYTGELQVRSPLRLTDRVNAPDGTDPGTLDGVVLPATAGCVATASTATGSDCSVATTLDAITPGVVKEGVRSVWSTGQLEVMDGGPDGDVDTADNSVFARQGIFVP